MRLTITASKHHSTSCCYSGVVPATSYAVLHPGHFQEQPQQQVHYPSPVATTIGTGVLRSTSNNNTCQKCWEELSNHKFYLPFFHNTATEPSKKFCISSWKFRLCCKLWAYCSNNRSNSRTNQYIFYTGRSVYHKWVWSSYTWCHQSLLIEEKNKVAKRAYSEKKEGLVLTPVQPP